ncbi:peptidoglycan-binding protein [Streptomyces sp. NPDC002187]|uniref:peptidoglycan-binding protein n=1 Tax=Streptomyces sp. NPDC002187 TaxID=3364637 RepID=UPI0036BBD0F6
MAVPAFEEYQPTGDCDCAGCAQQRRILAAGGHPAAHGCRRALVLLTAAGVVLGGSGGAAGAVENPPGTGPAAGGAAARTAGARTADGPEPATEQGTAGPLHGPAGLPATAGTPLRRLSRADIIDRAKRWVSAKVPYSMSKYWSDGYRQDCSGYVSMAWNLAGNEWTGSLAQFGHRILRDELEPGDILLFHNPDDPTTGSHVTIFGGWTDYTHTHYMAYEQTKPRTRVKATPMAYWTNSAGYVAYRYKGLATGTSGSEAPPEKVTAPPPAPAPVPGVTLAPVPGVAPVPVPGVAPVPVPGVAPVPVPGVALALFPGLPAFGPGANNAHITRLGELLIGRGGKRFYTEGPGPLWGEADRQAIAAFQLAQGWRGAEADGLPGPGTWQLLVSGTGRNIPAAATPVTTPGAAPVTAPATASGAVSASVPATAPGPAPVTTPVAPSGTRSSTPPGAEVPAFPGRDHFRPGRSGAHLTQLRQRLAERGHGTYDTSLPSPQWGEADRRNVQAFQLAQGWRGGEADGHPGPVTWRRLFS